jgi:hypothetical protein
VLDESPSRFAFFVDTVKNASSNLEPLVAQQACAFARQAINDGSRSLVQQAARDLGNRSFDKTILKQCKEGARARRELKFLRTRVRPTSVGVELVKLGSESTTEQESSTDSYAETGAESYAKTLSYLESIAKICAILLAWL